MSGASSIEWTDATWNPVRGCSRVSEGCRNCYAERNAIRFARPKEPGAPEKSPAGGYAGFVENTKAGPRWTGKVELIPTALDWPLRKRKPLRIFVNSMSDLFHEKLSDEAIAAVFGIMAACPQHTFQILTKRPDRMRAWFAWSDFMGQSTAQEATADHAQATRNVVWDPRGANAHLYARLPDQLRLRRPWVWPLPNVWLGTSVENQATADERISHLLATPAAKRFVSYEPALGPVGFGEYVWPRCMEPTQADHDANCLGGMACDERSLDWIIVGGESGPGARPFDIAWARSTVEQCRDAGVAVFVKQLGAKPKGLGTDLRLQRVSDRPELQADTFPLDLVNRKGGDWNEWPEDLRVREFPT